MIDLAEEHAIVDLDSLQDDASKDPPRVVSECSCGTRRTNLRHWALSPCASRALARLKAAHPEEYAQYLSELKAEALADFEVRWSRHMAGDHGR